ADASSVSPVSARSAVSPVAAGWAGAVRGRRPALVAEQMRIWRLSRFGRGAGPRSNDCRSCWPAYPPCGQAADANGRGHHEELSHERRFADCASALTPPSPLVELLVA